MKRENLVIALTKGRILDDVLPLFARAGLEPAEDIQSSRKLIFPTNHEHIELMVIRGSDVPTYVELGSADMGVVGKDMLMEYGSEGFYEPLDLQLAKCRLMTAAPVGIDLGHASYSMRRLRIASKFVNITKRYFAAQGRQIEIVKLNGALELAPSMGLADAIVDIVDSGKTLEANGLEPLELITNISSRIIVNKAAMKVKNRAIKEILSQLKEAVEQESKRNNQS